MTEEIVWKDPPPKRRNPKSSVWVTRLSPLMERPLVWARIYQGTAINSRQLYTRLSRGERLLPSGDWEFTTRCEADKGALYARYLGPKEKS